MILISAAGSGGTNELVRGSSQEFIGITNNRYKLFTSVLAVNILVPSATDEENYIKKVNEIIKEYAIELFIPNSDIEVYIVSKNLHKIETKTFLPSVETVAVTLDKWKFYQKMKSLNVSVAKTFLINEKQDIVKAFEHLKQTPLWCRVRDGAGSKYTSKVITPEDAQAYIEHCLNVYNLKMDDFLISEYLGGEDFAVMTIWKKGMLKLCKMAKRVAYIGAAGESPPNVIETFYDENVHTFVEEAIKKLDSDADGILNVDMKCYSDGSYAITEINAGRFYYNMPLFNYGELNAFEAFFNIVDGKEIVKMSDDPEVIFIREQDNRPVVIEKKVFQNTKEVYP